MEALAVLDEVYIQAYLAPYRGQTRRRYQAILLDWLRFLIGARLHILQGSRTLIEQWASTQTCSPTTTASRLVPVCGFYRWAHQQGLVSVDQGAYVRRPHRPRRSNLRWLDQDQATRLLAASLAAGPPASGLIHLLLLNGLRLGETLNARIEHLGARDGLVTLLLPHRKMGAMDVVSLPTETVTALAECIGDRGRGLLLGPRHLTPPSVYRLMDALSDSAGLDFRARPHMLRATFVTLSLDAGVPARDIIASAGWVSPQMLDYYDRAHASIRRNAAHRLAEYLTKE